MTTEDRANPETLLKRAVDAVDLAYARAYDNPPNSVQDWAEVAKAASAAGMLALDIQNSEPRTVVVDGLSQSWRELFDSWQNQAVKSSLEMVISEPVEKPHTVYAWLSPEEWDTIRARRDNTAGTASGEDPEIDAAGRTGTRGTPTRPRDLDDSDVEADGSLMEDLQAQERTINELRQMLIVMLLRQTSVSDYLPGSLMRQAPLWSLTIEKSPADGAVSLHIRRDGEDTPNG